MNPSQKKFKAKPPDKGSFPLDHEGECKQFMKQYMDCLKEHSSEHVYCRDLAQEYLLCRMNRELMTREDWTKLGFQNNTNTSENASNNKSKQ